MPEIVAQHSGDPDQIADRSALHSDGFTCRTRSARLVYRLMIGRNDVAIDVPRALKIAARERWQGRKALGARDIGRAEPRRRQPPRELRRVGRAMFGEKAELTELTRADLGRLEPLAFLELTEQGGQGRRWPRRYRRPADPFDIGPDPGSGKVAGVCHVSAVSLEAHRWKGKQRPISPRTPGSPHRPRGYHPPWPLPT